MKKILFIRHRLDTIGGTGVFTVLLMNELIQNGDIIGLYAQNQSEFKLQSINEKIKIITDNSDYSEVDWDIIIVQNILSFEYAKSLLVNINAPIIFISHSSSAIDQPIFYEKISLVIKIAEGVDVAKWGMPKEFVEVLRNPVEICKGSVCENINENHVKLLAISRLGIDKMDLLRKLILVVNQLSNVSLTIVGGGPSVSFKLLNNISNRNIRFVGEQIDIKKFYKESDIVIGSGRVAVEAMANSKPCILWGMRGYEGQITQSNYHKLKTIMFSGNINGEVSTLISAAKLSNDIKRIISSDNYYSDIKTNLKNVKKDFHPSRIVSDFLVIIENVLQKDREVNDFNLFMELKPKLVSCIDIIKTKNNEYQIINRDTNCTVEVIPTGLAELLMSFNGEKSNLEFASFITDSLGYVRFVKKLFSRKIVFLEKNN